ncbi:sensor histidine kinase [Beduini massiliensis]|uniref:sensor histidine kinase n=1 Tax=Beduini massiliensis TaxID=1585974 RepID=UPI00059A7EC0|nr:HAMP domain-containing sensor histidine kinase [Beduini massiliensis]
MKSIYGKLILGFLVSILISFSFAGYFVLKNNSEELSEFTRVELQDATRLILNQMTYVEDSQVGQVLTNISESLNVAILVSHDDSEIVYGQFKKPDKLDEAISNLKEKKEGYIDMRNSFFQTVGTHFEIDGTQYTLFVQKNISQQENIFKHSALLAVGFIFIVGSVVFLIIADIIVKPITRLTRATQELAKGNYKVSVNYVGNDEIGRLNKSFNLMAQQLGKTEQTRQQFISDVSHEFQTPLTSINGFATILKNEDLPPEQREKYTDIILFESRRLSQLSKNMLQLTLLDGEDITLNVENYSLTEQLYRVISSLEEFAKQKDIEIDVNIPKKDIMISGDQNRLEQVWINLLNNAIKYTNEGGYISVNLKRNSKDVEVMISDTGIGMDEEAQRHIFERFYREDKARSVGGNGLGLAIVKSIVDLHFGTIKVKSQKDVGSEFYVNLPYERNNTLKEVFKSYRKEG